MDLVSRVGTYLEWNPNLEKFFKIVLNFLTAVKVNPKQVNPKIEMRSGKKRIKKNILRIFVFTKSISHHGIHTYIKGRGCVTQHKEMSKQRFSSELNTSRKALTFSVMAGNFYRSF